MHFFGGADLGPQSPRDGSDGSASESGEHESPDQPASHSAVGDNTAASVVSAANDSMNLLQQLITKAPRDPRFAKSINVIRSQLSTLVLLATADENGSWLPEKEYIAPNQHSWPETATRMGETHRKKRAHGKVNSVLMAQHISKPNRKQTTNDNPYGAGEQSGKCAKPDACSAAANT